MKKNFPVTGRENDYDETRTIISTTDLKGVITYVNQDFIEICGFSEDELVGKSHNVVRHPDMPPAAFQDLWDTIKGGASWRGIVKNRCRNGDHYWVDAFVTPVYRNGQLQGYQSVRVKPSRDQIAAADRLYRAINEGKQTLKKSWRAADLSLGTKVGAAFGILLALMTAMAGLILTADASKEIVLPLAGAISLSWLLGLLLAGAFGTAVVGYALIHRTVTVPLRAGSEIAKTIASGDLRQPLQVTSNDEVGQVLQSIKMLQARLQMVIGRLAEATQRISTDAAEVAAVAEQASADMDRQHLELDQAATAMNEMSAAVQEVAGHATNAADKTEDADAEACAGEQVMHQVIDSINDVASEVEQAGSVLGNLEAASNSIGTIVEVIRDIAEQTNLLALNAAIEAARAGDQGRGFAVVADEVRTLAQRTQNSTQEIQVMIENLQGETGNAVAVMGRGRDKARAAVDQVSQAGKLLKHVAQLVTEVNDLNAQIATAAEEQGNVSEEVDRNIVNISRVADETAAGARETARHAEDLVAQIRGLTDQLSQFKL